MDFHLLTYLDVFAQLLKLLNLVRLNETFLQSVEHFLVQQGVFGQDLPIWLLLSNLLLLLRKVCVVRLVLFLLLLLCLQQGDYRIFDIVWVDGEVVGKLWGLLRSNLVSLDSIHVLVLQHAVNLVTFLDKCTIYIQSVFQATTVALDSLLVILDHSFDVWVYHHILLKCCLLCPILTLLQLLRDLINRLVLEIAQLS